MSTPRHTKGNYMDITNQSESPTNDSIEDVPWARDTLHISTTKAYLFTREGTLPGVFKFGHGQYRISVKRFWREIDGEKS